MVVIKWIQDLWSDEPRIAIPKLCECCGQQAGLTVIPFSDYHEPIVEWSTQDSGSLGGPIYYSINKLQCNEAAFNLAMKEVETYYR